MLKKTNTLAYFGLALEVLKNVFSVKLCNIPVLCSTSLNELIRDKHASLSWFSIEAQKKALTLKNL
jgi:hypothetical protein